MALLNEFGVIRTLDDTEVIASDVDSSDVDDDELRESEKFSSNFVFDESDVFQNASWNNFPKSRSKPGTLEEKIAQIREERRQKKLNKPPKIEKDEAEDEMEGEEKEESQEQNGVLESETEEMAVLSSENEDKDGLEQKRSIKEQFVQCREKLEHKPNLESSMSFNPDEKQEEQHRY
ncbi:hypothetical protein AVEN_185619-1 [Araneus ventricosus]|uniref:Uncharacterized protein n=1 Tax=Araneus ventricosus TaxID=182803 RepID=A0A4Y2TFE7_ARAVE|nr:hypothetical protein AVEN_185619-1 [Araneus ventricosus]